MQVLVIGSGYVALVLMSPATCLAAAYAPGTDTRVEPLDAPAAPAPAGNGIRWMAAPVRLNGSVALDLRWLRMEDGSRTSQALVYNDIDAATYIWQPWFALLRGGVGVLAERSVFSASGGAGDTIARTGSLTGRVALTVFPASRFPFEIRADVSDSRVSGDNLGADYRSQRLGITQSWRPVSGADSVLLVWADVLVPSSASSRWLRVAEAVKSKLWSPTRWVAVACM